MSGGGNKKKPPRTHGWEDAGSDFYQESYPMDGDSIEALHRDPKHLATLLPSKQTRAAAAATIRLRTNDYRTMRRQTSSRSRRDSTIRRPSMPCEVQVSMLPDLSENLSNEQKTHEEIMQIKAMPVSMAQKKELKAKILNEPNLRLQGYEQFKWKRRKMWHQFKSRVKETYTKLELWRSDLKHIEGNFGTGVVAYFLFIKWLFTLNFFMFSGIFLFVTLPSILMTNATANCNANSTDNNVVLDFIQGTGYLECTLLYYGVYVNEILTSIVGDATMYYNLPLAYISLTIICFMVSLVAIVRSAAKGFRDRLIEGEGQFYQYCNLIFGGWDFCIHNEKSAKIKHNAIYREIKITLHSEKLEEERQSRTRNEHYRIILFRCIANFLVVVILAACGCAIYFVFDLCMDKLTTEEYANRFEQLVFEFLPSITIVCLNLAVPFIFRFLITFENFSPMFVVRLTLIRTVLLRMASLFVLYASLLLKITCNQPFTDEKPCNNAMDCWETYVGQQIYKLLITDFATHLILTFVVNFARALLARHVSNKFVRLTCEQSFDLPKHVLDVVYAQTLCWFGFFYAPMISAMAAAIFFLMFYIKKFACMVNSKPSAVLYRASRSNSMFMMVLLVSLIFAMLPIAYSISELWPSRTCGPFSGLESVWELIVHEIEMTPDWVKTVGYFVSTAGFVIPVVIVLLLLLYYYTAVNAANRHMVVVLKNQLVLEGHDKQFLLNELSKFIKQENQKRMRHADMMREGDRIVSST